MINASYLAFGLRKHLEERLGIPSVIRFVGYKQPEEDNFTTVTNVSVINNIETKNKDFINEKVYMQVGNYAGDIVTLGEQQAVINDILRYESIPIINLNGEEVGRYSIVDITGGAIIPYGVALEDETESIRNFTDFVAEIQHIKKSVN